MTAMRLLTAILAACLLSACDSTTEDSSPAIQVDLLISGGTVFDGSGSAAEIADIGVTDGRIAFIGDADRAGVEAAEVIDAGGHWVAPGFIDAHVHVLAAAAAAAGPDCSPRAVSTIDELLEAGVVHETEG